MILILCPVCYKYCPWIMFVFQPCLLCFLILFFNFYSKEILHVLYKWNYQSFLDLIIGDFFSLTLLKYSFKFLFNSLLFLVIDSCKIILVKRMNQTSAHIFFFNSWPIGGHLGYFQLFIIICIIFPMKSLFGGFGG